MHTITAVGVLRHSYLTSPNEENTDHHGAFYSEANMSPALSK